MYTVRIQNNETMEVREYPCDLEWHESSMFWWTEGNMACDCNRQWEFERAGGEPTSEDPECGDNRYTVIDVTLDNGEVLLVDGR